MKQPKVKLWSVPSARMTVENAKDRKALCDGIEFTAKPKYPYLATYKDCGVSVLGNLEWDHEQKKYRTWYSITVGEASCNDPAKMRRFREDDLTLAIIRATMELKKLGDRDEKCVS